MGLTSLRVSVIVPIHNPGPILDRCFASIKRQTWVDMEIVPIDDAGEQPVRPLIDRFAADDARWKPIYHLTNHGLAASLNDGIRSSTGDYILFLQQDCELLSADAIERAIQVAQAHLGWCLSGSRILPYTELTPAETAFVLIQNHMPSSDGSDLSSRAFTELKCDLFPREALVSVGGLDERYRISGEDQVLSIRLRERGWEIVTSSALGFILRSGRNTTVASNLRREFRYGTSQALVLAATRKVVRMNHRLPQGRGRLWNRFGGAVSGLCLAAALLAALVMRNPWLVAVALLVPATRVIMMASRGLRLKTQVNRALESIILACAITPVDDFVYLCGLILGSIRSLGGGGVGQGTARLESQHPPGRRNEPIRPET